MTNISWFGILTLEVKMLEKERELEQRIKKLEQEVDYLKNKNKNRDSDSWESPYDLSVGNKGLRGIKHD